MKVLLDLPDNISDVLTFTAIGVNNFTDLHVYMTSLNLKKGDYCKIRWANGEYHFKQSWISTEERENDI